MLLRSTLVTFSTLILLGGCAHGGDRLDKVAISDVARRDPWEKTNRGIFDFTMKVDRYALKPASNVYRTVVPPAPRRGISNAYNLVHEPTNMANALAQGKVKSAFRAFDRILINSFLGLGVADHASDMGLVEQSHDFGQTLAIWGVPSGPFVVLPLLGPNTARDSFGFFVDFLLDPFDPIEYRLISSEERLFELGVNVVNTRSNLRDKGEQILVGAADPYATTRSAWLQLRRYEIFDGSLPADEEEEEDIPPPPGDPVPETPDKTPAIPEEAPSPAELPSADTAPAPESPAPETRADSTRPD